MMMLSPDERHLIPRLSKLVKLPITTVVTVICLLSTGSDAAVVGGQLQIR